MANYLNKAGQLTLVARCWADKDLLKGFLGFGTGFSTFDGWDLF